MTKVKAILFVFFIICSIEQQAQLNIIEQLLIEGKYNGKNLYVRNSSGEGGIGYCVREVLVNGKNTMDKINGDIFMIDLNALNLKMGENTSINIVYGQNCNPRTKPILLNPGALISYTNKDPNYDTFTIEGGYIFQNLFIVNQVLPNGKTYGLNEIVINGKPYTGIINSPNIEIDLFQLKFNYYEKLKIEFKYVKGYDPTIINPEALSN